MRRINDDRQAFRAKTTRREAPSIIGSLLVVYVLISLSNWATGVASATDRLIDVLVVAFLLLARSVVRRPGVPVRLVPWPIALSAVLLGVGTVAEAWIDPTGPDFTYLVVILVAFPPFVLAWEPTVVAMTVLVPLMVALGLREPGADGYAWILAGAAAAASGLVLMHARLRAIDALHEADTLVRSMATRDRLTGLLNRHGIEERLPELVGVATRHGEPMFATFVDIDGLKAANDTYGHEFGDQVIVRVATALRHCVRGGDVLARWGGDEFVIVGIGETSDPEAFAARVTGTIHPMDRSGWAGTVSVGTASVRDGDVARVLHSADEDMYARRRARRSSNPVAPSRATP